MALYYKIISTGKKTKLYSSPLAKVVNKFLHSYRHTPVILYIPWIPPP